MRFRFAHHAIDGAAARVELLDPGAGGFVTFEGWVRDFNEGREVTALEYEAFEALAVKEGERIVAEAAARFPVRHALCIHRVGRLALTDLAVWVGVSATHRGEAFDACRFIIDAVKHRLPIWKKEHYRNGDSGWVNCEACAAAPHAAAPHAAAPHTAAPHASAPHAAAPHTAAPHASAPHAAAAQTAAPLAAAASHDHEAVHAHGHEPNAA